MIAILIAFVLAAGYALFRWAPIFVAECFITVPAYHFGVRERFGKRSGNALFEGFHFKLPFIEKVELVSMELASTDVEVDFTTQDKLHLILRGTLQYRPNPSIKNDKGEVLFVEMSEDIIAKGIIDTVRSKLGALGGKYDGFAFVENRNAIGDIINAFLRDKTPVHLRHQEFCSRTDCPFRDYDRIAADKLIDFYNEHWRELKEMKYGAGSNSREELRYGIDIEIFPVAYVDFSPETRKAFEQEQQAEAREQVGEIKYNLIKRFKRMGLTPEAAANAADVILYDDIAAGKKIHSVEGLGDLLSEPVDHLLDAFRKLKKAEVI